MKTRVLSLSVVSDSLGPPGLQPIRLLCPWNSTDNNMGVGSNSFLQGIFPTQRSNPCLLHCRWILHRLSHQGNPSNYSLFFHFKTKFLETVVILALYDLIFPVIWEAMASGLCPILPLKLFLSSQFIHSVLSNSL